MDHHTNHKSIPLSIVPNSQVSTSPIPQLQPLGGSLFPFALALTGFPPLSSLHLGEEQFARNPAVAGKFEVIAGLHFCYIELLASVVIL